MRQEGPRCWGQAIRTEVTGRQWLPRSWAALAPQPCRIAEPGSSPATGRCWQQEREQASPLSVAIFRCWREAEER